MRGRGGRSEEKGRRISTKGERKNRISMADLRGNNEGGRNCRNNVTFSCSNVKAKCEKKEELIKKTKPKE